MKVLNLQCNHGHNFEGWFGSEADFLTQCERNFLQCPLCGDSSVKKMLSAPRLNLSAKRVEPVPAPPDFESGGQETDLSSAWLTLARQVIANTLDVGSNFAEEARKMHYGDVQERSIRGQTTPQEARTLIEEGINVIPFALPDSLKETLQ
jgi:hypothetical protein